MPDNVYQLEITATDAQGASATQSVSVSVQDAVEATFSGNVMAALQQLGVDVGLLRKRLTRVETGCCAGGATVDADSGGSQAGSLPATLPDMGLTLLDYLTTQAISTASASEPTTRYVDILLTGNDLTLDDSGCPAYVSDRASIAQDICDMLKDTGLLISLIGQRDREMRQLHFVKIEQEIEDDVRILPGSARVQESAIETYWISARTMDYQEIGFYYP